MPISFTAIGDALVATVIDDNFDAVDEYLNEGLTGSEISSVDKITKYRVRKYDGGKLTSAIIRENYIYGEDYGVRANNIGYYDVLGRNPTNAFNGGYPPRGSSPSRVMELLGYPGGSFYYDFQERGDVYTLPSTVWYPAAVAGHNPPNRYPEDVCYSRWLTVPNCSKKVWIDGPCIVKVSAMFHAMLLQNFWGRYQDVGTTISPHANNIDSWDNEPDKIGRQAAMMIGLVVDTNPVLYDDEFPNTNPHIQVNGVQASYKSWEFVEQKSIYAGGVACKNDIEGFVTLKGGRYYNFSLKFKDAATIGYVSGGNFYDSTYEQGITLGTFDTTWYNSQGSAAAGIFEVMWLAQSLNIEVFYGHGSIESNLSDITSLEG